jgi:hypothetical protein
MMSAPFILRKHPSETLDITVDYTHRLAVGETLVSATANVVGAGTIIVGATPSVASPIVTCRVSDGTNGQTDSFLVLATTSTGEILDAVVYMMVSAENIFSPIPSISGATPTFCVITGFVVDYSGGPKANSFVRVRILGGVSAVTGSVTLSSSPLSEYTDESGVFQFTLPCGVIARIEIPESDLDASFTVPDLATATLANITLDEYEP